MSECGQHVCIVCGTKFQTDQLGRRESDWIKNDTFCDITCNLAHVDIEEGRSITDVVRFGDAEAAARRVRNLFDAHEFKVALNALALAEVDRLSEKRRAA